MKIRRGFVVERGMKFFFVSFFFFDPSRSKNSRTSSIRGSPRRIRERDLVKIGDTRSLRSISKEKPIVSLVLENNVPRTFGKSERERGGEGRESVFRIVGWQRTRVKN